MTTVPWMCGTLDVYNFKLSIKKTFQIGINLFIAIFYYICCEITTIIRFIRANSSFFFL